MKYILLLFLLLNLTCYGRTTYEQVKSNKPTLTDQQAMLISQAINTCADKYKIPANVIAGIAMVESSYRLRAVNKRSNDYGIMQINEYNIKAYKLSKTRLLYDLDYSIDAGCKIFQWFYKRYNLEEAVKRYNCGTKKSCITWKGPVNYWKKVKKYK